MARSPATLLPRRGARVGGRARSRRTRTPTTDGWSTGAITASDTASSSRESRPRMGHAREKRWAKLMALTGRSSSRPLLHLAQPADQPASRYRAATGSGRHPEQIPGPCPTDRLDPVSCQKQVLEVRPTSDHQLADNRPPRGRLWTSLTIDDLNVLDRATRDPSGLLASVPGPLALDEVQRAPDLLLAIKVTVDRDRADSSSPARRTCSRCHATATR